MDSWVVNFIEDIGEGMDPDVVCEYGSGEIPFLLMGWFEVVGAAWDSKVIDVGDVVWVTLEIVELCSVLISEALATTSTGEIVLWWGEGHNITTSYHILEVVAEIDSVERLGIVLVQDVDVVFVAFAVDFVGYQGWFGGSEAVDPVHSLSLELQGRWGFGLLQLENRIVVLEDYFFGLSGDLDIGGVCIRGEGLHNLESGEVPDDDLIVGLCD